VVNIVYSIVVDLSVRKLNLFFNGNLVNSFPVGVGKMLTPTPTGTYTIVNKAPNPGGPFGVMWMGLSKPTYGIHGTNDPASIGHIVSHGCIRMYNRDVIELSRIVPIGTFVTIVNK
jgi:lipoprotein-anchoring transpeptidase ErfK/SrfK